MKRSKILIMTMVIIATLSGSSLAHDLVWPGEKLKALFPQAVSFEQKNLYVSEEQRSSLEKALGMGLPEEDLKPSIYLAVVKEGPDTKTRKAAAIIFIDVYGAGGKIEMGVVVGGKGEILKTRVFENNEAGKLSASGFLRQFEGKKPSDVFKVGSDITALPGLEISAQAIASGARRGLLLINEMFKRK